MCFYDCENEKMPTHAENQLFYQHNCKQETVTTFITQRYPPCVTQYTEVIPYNATKQPYHSCCGLCGRNMSSFCGAGYRFKPQLSILSFFSAYLGWGHRGSNLSRDGQNTLSPATSSSRGTPIKPGGQGWDGSSRQNMDKWGHGISVKSYSVNETGYTMDGHKETFMNDLYSVQVFIQFLRFISFIFLKSTTFSCLLYFLFLHSVSLPLTSSFSVSYVSLCVTLPHPHQVHLSSFIFTCAHQPCVYILLSRPVSLVRLSAVPPGVPPCGFVDYCGVCTSLLDFVQTCNSFLGVNVAAKPASWVLHF